MAEGQQRQQLPVVRIGTWNTRNLSTRRDEQRRYDILVQLLRAMHVCALQEVMEVAVLDKIQGMMPKQYRYVVSPGSVGKTGGRREYYAFFYDSDVLELKASALFDDSARDALRREPFVATFKARWGFDFTLLNVHILYGSGKRERRPELLELARAAVETRRQNGQEENLMLVGDFNFEPADKGFAWIKRLGYVPLVDRTGKTTVGDVSLYDNIWMRKQDVDQLYVRGGVIPFDKWWYTPAEVQRARREVSDHRLVWVELRADRDFDADVYTRAQGSLALRLGCRVCVLAAPIGACSRCEMEMCETCFDGHCCGNGGLL